MTKPENFRFRALFGRTVFSSYKYGATGQIRTGDLFITSELLYLLSHSSAMRKIRILNLILAIKLIYYILYFFICQRNFLEICIACRTRERNDVSYILHTCEIHDQTLETKSVTGVFYSAVTS